MIDYTTVGLDINREFDKISADSIDPRLAPSSEIRERMIAARQRAGLSDYPANDTFQQTPPDEIDRIRKLSGANDSDGTKRGKSTAAE